MHHSHSSKPILTDTHQNPLRAFLQERVVNHLTGAEAARAKTYEYICGRVAAALSVTKSCATLQQWVEYSTILAAVMPAREDTMMTAVADVLGLRFGIRGGRERAASKALRRRAEFDERSRSMQIAREPPMAGTPLQVGEVVLCRGQLAELVEINCDGSCAVLFKLDGQEQRVDYKHTFGTAAGSARLQRPPPLLQSPQRAQRSDTVTAEVVGHVHEIYEAMCPESPHQKDIMRRRLDRHLTQEARARILMCTYEELYQTFKQQYPNDDLSLAMFKRLKPWNLKKAYRETCLCRSCELFSLYREALSKVASLLQPLCTSCEHSDDGEGTDAADANDAVSDRAVTTVAHEVHPMLAKLVEFCGCARKREMVDALVCGGNLDAAKPSCVRGSCPDCGFKKIWQPVRQTLVDSDGKLLCGKSPLWQSSLRYEVLRSGSAQPSDGSATGEKETLRERRESSIIEFLDTFQKASIGFPNHRHLIHAAKASALQRDRNFWPGMLLSDYDWSENGVIASARQIQSEYWSLVYYSLFIQITTYLVSDAWLDRSSLLSIGAEVTVEMEGSTLGELQPTPGAFYAKVSASPGQCGEYEMYSVKVYGHPEKSDGTVIDGILRKRLRHRVKHTTATIGITDEKRHDAHTTQHFLDQQFRHWLLHCDHEPFWAWIGHSDNASHFKSGAMMNYWSGKVSELDFLEMCWIDFGCPGHGKGPWDGLGAVLKQQVSRDITNGKALTTSGYVTCPAEVAEHLRARFATAKWMEKHQDKHINEMVVYYAPHEEIHRPRADHTYDSLEGSMSTYSYLMLAKNQIARRGRTCWCEGCFRARGRTNMRSAGATLICDDCSHVDKPEWVQQTVRDLGTGLAGRRKEAQEVGKKLAKALKSPSACNPNEGFMAIQAREQWSTSEDIHYRPGHYWLAQAPSILEVKRIDQRVTIKGTMFSPGDYLVRIGRYFDRCADDSSGLTFEEWTPPDGGSFIINATELRSVNFTVAPESAASVVHLREVRRSGRRAAVVSVPPMPVAKRYTIDHIIDDDIRSRCW